MVGNFQRNDSIIPTSNSGVAGFDAAGYAPFENKSWKNYHYGTASSADGVQWHSYSDVSMQVCFCVCFVYTCRRLIYLSLIADLRTG